MTTAREYRGVLITPLGANSWGGRWGAFTDRGYVKADTLAGIKQLITASVKPQPTFDLADVHTDVHEREGADGCWFCQEARDLARGLSR